MGVGLGCLGSILFVIILLIGASGDVGAGFFWFCIFGIFGSTFWGLVIDENRKENLSADLRKRLKEMVDRLADFSVSQEFVSPNMESYIALDEENKKVCIIENKYDNDAELSQTLSKYNYEAYILDFIDVLQTEILEDGRTINTTSRSSQIGGALLGGVLAGGVGAAIGGLSGSSSSTNEVKKIILQVIVNDTKKSFHRITFMSEDSFTSKDNSTYKNANKDVTHWHNLLSYIINIVDNEVEDSMIGFQNNESVSIADELRKFSELLNGGYITQAEFEIEKEKLMSK